MKDAMQGERERIMKGGSWIIWGLCLFVVALIVIGGGSMAWEYFVSGSAAMRVREAEAEAARAEAEAARAAAEADRIAAEADRLRAAGEMTRAEGESYKLQREGDAILAPAEAASRAVNAQTNVLSFYGFIAPFGLGIVLLFSSLPGVVVGMILGGLLAMWKIES